MTTWGRVGGLAVILLSLGVTSVATLEAQRPALASEGTAADDSGRHRTLAAVASGSRGASSASPEAGASTSTSTSTYRMSLAGEWRFALDPADRGAADRWFAKALEDRIQLPGALQNQGYGSPVTLTTDWVSTLHDPLWYRRAEYAAGANPSDIRIPFHLQPQRHYLGSAWYQRTVRIPAHWASRRVVLTLERPHWQTEVWVDERFVGSSDAMGTPHSFDLGQLTAGQHVLTVRVDNRMVVDVGRNAHSVTDATQGGWNGIVGDLALTSTSLVFLDDVQVYPRVATGSARVVVRLGNSSGKRGSGRLLVGSKSRPIRWDAKGAEAEVEVFLGAHAATWDEFSPILHRLQVRVEGPLAADTREVSFGLREIGVNGTQFALNGRRIYLRGTHDGCVFPLTGYPPTDVDSWRSLIRLAQAHGLNHMRFHSWCPPEAAFVAADELGFYLQPECSIWARDGVRLDPGTTLEKWLYDESLRMTKAYGNHPSFLLLSSGNEPQGRWVETLSRWVDTLRRNDPRRLYAAVSGVPMRHELGPVTGTDFYVITRIGNERVRGEGGWNGKDYRVPVEKTNVPIVSHELGQYSAYPDLDAEQRYTGPLRPRFLELFRQSLTAHGLAGQEQDFRRASGRLQALAYKEEVEACLRTPGHAGFQLLDLKDFPGQGFSPVGVVDALGQSKGSITPAQYRRFCNSTVPLARLSARTLSQPDFLRAEVEVAHFGGRPLADAETVWRVEGRDGRVVARGRLPRQTIEIGNAHRLGTVTVPTRTLEAPAAYRLTVGLEATPFENDWDFWVYPEGEAARPTGLLLSRSLDETSVTALARGGKVLLCPRTEDLLWESSPFTFAPIFWNRQLFPKRDRSLGLLADPRHPALAAFPTDGHSDWQWEPLIQAGTRAISLAGLPLALRPIVQAIDDWNRNEKQALLFEVRVGTGSLLVSAFDLTNPRSPAERQLLRSLSTYMAGERFAPRVSVSLDELRSLFFETRIMGRLGARATADVEAPGSAGGLAIDGDPETFWATPRGDGETDWPHSLTVALDREVAVTGFVLLTPQRDRKRIGEIADCVLEASRDGRDWTELARGRLASTYRTQRITLRSAVRTRHVRFTALSSHDGGRVAVLAELALILAAQTPENSRTTDPGGPEGSVPKKGDELDMSPPEP